MKKIVIIAAVIMLILINAKEENIVIPDSAIRFRIIANSNTAQDQNIKNNLEHKLETYLYSIVKDAKNNKEAKEKLLNNVDNVNSYIEDYLKFNHISSKFDVSIGNNYFPTKQYKGVKYEAGYYDSIVVRLGRSQGMNWWCVIYPPLCLIDSQEKEENNIEYTSLVQELIKKYNM